MQNEVQRCVHTTVLARLREFKPPRPCSMLRTPSLSLHLHATKITMNLFDTEIPAERLHKLFHMIRGPQYLPERRVLEGCAEGFIDRDGKFLNEFQTTFESSI
jgi:hypothetical protein